MNPRNLHYTLKKYLCERLDEVDEKYIAFWRNSVWVTSGWLWWALIFIGAIIGLLIILVDLNQARKGSDFRVPILAVAIGIYLPITLTVPIFIGGMINHYANKISSQKIKMR